MRLFLSCLSFVFLFFLALTGCGDSTGNLSEPASPDRLREIVEAARVDQKIPGLTIAVSTPRLQWSAALGVSDVENGYPTKLETVYRIASISKTLTATRVMQLAELGKLHLDDSINDFCHPFPKKQFSITFRQLLGHLGGIRTYRQDELGDFTNKRFYATITESLDIFKEDALVAQPGAEFVYSTYGYSLLGCGIEDAGAAPFMAQIKATILDPLGMAATRADNLMEVIPNRTRGYRLQSGQILNARLADTSNKVPGGGMVSTAGDLIRFGNAILEDRLMNEHSRRAAFSTMSTLSGISTGYGMGWGVGRIHGEFAAYHTGGQEGTSTILFLNPARKIVIVILANLEGASVKAIAESLLAHL